MKSKLAAIAMLFAVGALAFMAQTFKAQDRLKEANETLARADAAFEAKRFADAATDYARCSSTLPAGTDRDRAIARTLVCMSESGLHARLDEISREPGFAALAQRVTALDARIDYLRMAALYFAGRDHDFHQSRDGKTRDYRLDYDKLPDAEKMNWWHVNTVAQDMTAALALVSACHEASYTLLEVTPGAGAGQQQRHVAITMEYCDLLEVNDRMSGKARNAMHFFGSDYGVAGAEPASPEVIEEMPTDVPEEAETPAPEEAQQPQAAQPSEEPFTRRGYYMQPEYPNLRTINALMETAARRAADLKDPALQSAVLYRRAMMLMNVGLYGNARLNAELTDWRNAGKHEPDISRDPRPLLRKLLVEYKGSIWDDEARFLLGYVGYYLNDFAAARAEFAQLEKDHPKSKYIGEARRLVQVIEFPQLFTSFSTGGADYALVAPGQPLSVSLYARNVETVRVSLRPLDLSRVLGNAQNLEHAWTSLADIAAQPGFESALGASIMDQSFALDAANKHFYQSRVGLPLYTSTPGVFLLEVAGGPVLERKLVQIADLAVQRRRMAATEQFWLTTRSGSPLADVRIRGGYTENLYVFVPFRETVAVDPKDPRKGTTEVTSMREERRVVSHPVQGATDAQGMYEAAIPAHGLMNLWATLDIGGTLFLVNDAHEPREITDPAPWEPRPVAAPITDLRAFVYSDRPVYRPGDTAWLRVIARMPMGEGKIEGETALLRVMCDGIEQHRTSVTLNDFGCATARVEVPIGAPLGRYELLLRSPRIGEAAFSMRVLEYFKKDVKLEVETPRQPLAPGSAADIPVVFSYHAGGPVQGGDVRYSVTARSADGKSWRPAAGSAKANLEGRVVVRLDTLRISEEAAGRAVTLNISAEGTGPGGQTVHAQGEFKISGSGIKVEADWPDANWQSNRRVGVKLRVLDASGQRLRATGQSVVWRITDQTSLRPAQWNNPSIKRLDTQNFDDGARADEVAVSLPAQSGRYRIEIKGSSGDETFALSRDLMLVGNGVLDNCPFEIVPEYDSFDLTRPARVLVCQPAAGDVLLSLHANGSEHGHRILRNAPACGLHEVALAESDAPHIHLSARAVRDGKQQAAQYAVAVRPASRLIRTTVRFSKDRYKPGEEAVADIFTFDHQGKPVETEVALSVWDSALKEFASSALETTNLYDHFFAGVTQFVAADRSISAATRVKPTRRNDARVKRWKISAMPPGSFFHGAQCWTSTHRASLLDLYLESEGETVGGLFGGRDASDSMNDDWAREPVQDAASPYYGSSSAVGLGGGAGGGGGRGGFAHRRARGGGGSRAPDPAERRDFRDSAFFNANIRTDSKGVASISFKLPDNLTEWTFEATATDRAASIGQASGEFKAARDLGVRMVGPRGLTEGDEMELTALVQNLGEAAISVNTEVELNVEGATAPLAALAAPTPATCSLAPGASQEVRMRVRVSGTGSAALKVLVSSDDDADSLVWRYAVKPRGIMQTSTQTFRIEGGSARFDLKPEFPAGVILDHSNVSVQFNGSLIGSVIDALPGLVNYPYGCAEQTTNKFVPLLAALSLLRANKLDLYELGKTRMGYDGPVESDNWPEQLSNPVELQKMVNLGFGNLRKYQNYDGGWGWFTQDGSAPHLSATVLAGLCTARSNAPALGLGLPASQDAMNGIFQKGAGFLVQAAGNLGNDPALRARALHAASWAVTFLPPAQPETADPYKSLRENLSSALIAAQAALPADSKAAIRDGGGSAGLASLALALHHGGRARDAQVVLKHLLAAGETDKQGNLLFPSGSTQEFRWYDAPVEAHALAIQAIATISPKDTTLKRAVDGLIGLKNGTGWGNTRATGQAVSALASYLGANPDLADEARVRIELGGVNVGTFERTKDNLLSGRTRWDIGGAQWQGKPALPINLSRSGAALVTGTMTVRAFMPVAGTLRGASHGLTVRRDYLRRTSIEREVEVEVQDERGNVKRRYRESRIEYETTILKAGEALKVGDVITVTISVNAAKGDRYLCVEDARPSCLEPITSRFEEAPGSLRALGGVYLTKEERDTTTNFFAATVDGGGGLTFRYDCVVVCAGKFTSLPARVFDMYDESRNGHSDSATLEVK